ncbi:hypothetical protein [Sinomonas soli]
MTEQPAELVPAHPFIATVDDAITKARAFQAVVVPLAAPVDEQVWLGNEPDGPRTVSVKDPGMAAAFDQASDAYDAAGAAFEDGRLTEAKNHAYVFLAALTRMQIAEAAAPADD